MLEKTKKILSIDHEPISVDAVKLLIHESAYNGEMTEWLSAVGENTLAVPWSAELLRLYAAREITERQKGYSVTRPNRPYQWSSDWIVFGDIISDPLIFDSSTSPGRVLFAFHGHGDWRPLLLAPSFSKFDTALATWCELFLTKYQREVFTDDFVLRGDFLKELRGALSKALPESCVEVFLRALE